MKLVDRVSAFFLLALAAVLAGSSVLLYFLISRHLYRQFDQQLYGALNSLVAAVEVEPDGVKWQPSEHTIALGLEGEADEVRWVLVDSLGTVVDHSRNLSDQVLIQLALRTSPVAGGPQSTGSWRFLRRSLSASQPKPLAELDSDEFAEVDLLVALNPAPIRSESRRLAILLVIVPASLWLFAALAGRSYCRRALQPLEDMVARVRTATTADFHLRLPVRPDRDELTDLALAFNGLLDQLHSAFDRQRRFTGDAAHQLRTPLTVLLGQMEVALRRPRTTDEYRRTLSVLHEQTVELQQIVEALLFLARTDEDAAPLEMQHVRLSVWLPQHLGRWQSHARAADIVLQSDSAACAEVSPPLLGQLVDNLLSNALKYSSPGTPVTVSVEDDGPDVVIAIEDHGIGIALEEQTAIFEPFFRSENARRSGATGTGLGLSVAARSANALGGRLGVESEPGKGSRFALRLRAQPADCPESASLVGAAGEPGHRIR